MPKQRISNPDKTSPSRQTKAELGMPDDFVEALGLPFLARIMDRLQDKFAQGFAEWYCEIGIRSPVRTQSLMRAIDEQPRAVTELAELLGQSHPVIVTWVKRLTKIGLVSTAADPRDRRRTLVRLTASGRRDLARQKHTENAILAAYRRLLSDADAQVFEPLWRIETQLRARSFVDRLRDAHAEQRL